MDNNIQKADLSKEVSGLELNLENLDDLDVMQYKKIMPVDPGTAGLGLNSVLDAMHHIKAGKEGTTGIYRVTVPKGAHMAQFKDGRGFLGACLKTNNQVGGGNAVITPVMFNPAMMYMTLALEGINRKLDAIEAMQREIFDYLKDKDESAIKGNLEMLQDIYKQYAFNVSNASWKDAYRMKVVDVKQEATKNINLYRKQIEKKLESHKPGWMPHTEKQLETPFKALKKDFTYYKLALYMYAFASFLEVMLVENFNAGYLNEISGKIDCMALAYKELYTKSYDVIAVWYNCCVGAVALKGAAEVSKTLGKVMRKTNNVMERAAEKVPGKMHIEFNKKVPQKLKNIEGFEINKALSEGGEKLDHYQEKQIYANMKDFVELKNSSVRPFIENIRNVNEIFNSSVDLIVDKENVFIGTREV